jgi:hypothetical protein
MQIPDNGLSYFDWQQYYLIYGNYNIGRGSRPIVATEKTEPQKKYSLLIIINVNWMVCN